jgi:hypothetical protein
MLLKVNFSPLMMTLFFVYISIKKINSKIIFVFEHARHGTRTPPYDEDSNYTDQFGTKWEGNGELTAVGKRMHYILGIQNRIKYSSLIDFSKLNPKEIQIFSTNSVRTLRSIEAELHGMYLPGTGEILTKDELPLAYPPGKEYLPEEVLDEIEQMDNSTIINGINLFPIQFFQTGKVFLNTPDNCPYMTSYQLKLGERINKTLTEFMKDFDKKYGDNLREYLNRPNKDFIYTYGSLIDITDNYICNYDNGKNLTDFLTKTGFDKEEFYQSAIEVKKFYLFHLNCDQQAGVLGATPHMLDLINYMENRINDENNVTYSKPKMVIQGGHDTTLNVLQFFMQKAFNIDLQYIKFGANIYFELHKDEINNTNKYNYTVKYFYDGKLLLTLDYDSFKQKVLETVWNEEQIHNFCFQEENDKNEQKDDNEVKVSYSLFIALIITTILLLITTIIFLLLFLYFRHKASSITIVSNDELIE